MTDKLNKQFTDMQSWEFLVSSMNGFSLRDFVEKLRELESTSPSMSAYVALTEALLRTFRIELRERSLMSISPEFRMRLPLGRHTMQVAQSFAPDMLMHGRMWQTHDGRVNLLSQFLDSAMQPLEQWIDIAKNATRYTVKEILRIKNIEQRMSALRIMGADRLIQEAHAELISKSPRGNELYKIPAKEGIFTTDAYFLKYSCVSTGRVYVSGVHPQLFDRASEAIRVSRTATVLDIPVTTVQALTIEPIYVKEYPRQCWADLAMAWKFRLSYEQYMSLTRSNEA